MIINERTTAKYRYVTEMIETPKQNFFIDFPGGHICTAYDSEQNARKNIPYMARLFHFNPDQATISAENAIHTEIRHHRYKV